MAGAGVERADVVVVGGGTAAFEAAVASCQAGAGRVVMLEKAPESEFGGNARFSHTGFRFTFYGKDEIRGFVPHIDDERFARMHIAPYTVEDFTADTQRTCRGRANPALVQVLTGESNAALHWMLELGITFELDTAYEVDGIIYFEPGQPLHVVGDGIGQLGQWLEIANRMGIELRFGTRVSGILGNDRRVEGVHVSGPDGEYDLEAKAVVLCSGGFQASAEQRARYLGPSADLFKVRGSRHDTGEVLQMALALGASSSGQWQGANASPIDATYPDVEVSNKGNRYSYMHGITVNSRGLRFFDEGEGEHSFTYATAGWGIINQTGGVAYQLFDKKGIDVLRWQYGKHAEAVVADTVEELARKLGMEPAILKHTIDTFNGAVMQDVPFNPGHLDGKGTVGIHPPKSNWAAPLDEPPYHAYAVTGGITFTYGGLQVDTDARVLNTGLNPIEGLYASGDILGLFYYNYPGGGGQTRNVVFSRVAARHIGKTLG